MDIGVPIRGLGEVDVANLQETVLSQPDVAWDEDNQRQDEYHVHRQTKSLVMLFASETWPKVVVSKEKAWDRIADAALPVMDDILQRFYPPGGKVIRAVAARLAAGGKISPHIDTLESFAHGHRIHVPISTNKFVRFMIDGRPYQFEVGRAYEINNLKTHSVINAGKEDRITLIFDYVPPEVAKEQNAVFVDG